MRMLPIIRVLRALKKAEDSATAAAAEPPADD